MIILWTVLNHNHELHLHSSNVVLKIRRSDGYLYDFSDLQFKTSNIIQDTVGLTEDALLYGTYYYNLDIHNFIDSDYLIYGMCLDLLPILYTFKEFQTRNGQEIIQGTYTQLTTLQDSVYHLTHTENDIPISIIIPLPEASNMCRVYELCYDQGGQSPVISVQGYASIINIPYDYNGKLHIGSKIAEQHMTDPESGLSYIYWDLVWESTVKIVIYNYGIDHTIIVPKVSTIRLANILNI